MGGERLADDRLSELSFRGVVSIVSRVGAKRCVGGSDEKDQGAMAMEASSCHCSSVRRGM